MLAGSFALIVVLVAVALIFDFLNGLHDTANSIATVVSTRVLSPNIAVIWAAFFNFIAFLFFGLHVAQTIGTGLIAPEVPLTRHIRGAHGCNHLESCYLEGCRSLIEFPCLIGGLREGKETYKRLFRALVGDRS